MYLLLTAPERILPHCDMYLYAKPLQVNLFQKHLFLQQLTHNILSYCGLVDARIRASNIYLSVQLYSPPAILKQPFWQKQNDTHLFEYIFEHC